MRTIRSTDAGAGVAAGAGARRGSRLLRLGALTLVVAVLLSACASIPRSGAVHAGDPITQDDNGLGPVVFVPSGPVAGSTQQEVLQGFIGAALSPQGSYQIARSFLTSGFGSRWDPDSSVTVDSEADRHYSDVGDNQRQLAVTPDAFVDADGNFRRAESTTPIQQQYSFTKQKGEWRISKAPNGVVIAASRFANVFSAHPIYFFSPDYSYLVPDERWFPTTSASTRTRIVKELVTEGPAKWLTGALTSAFPPGSQLTVDSVPVTGNQVEVDLNSTAGSADLLELQRMKLQLTQSLSTIASAAEVKILIEGVERNVPDLSGKQPVVDPSVDANPLVMRAGKFGFLSGSSVVGVPDISSRVDPLAPSAATLSADRTTAAVLNVHGAYLVRTSGDPILVDSRAGLVAPSLDEFGYAWTVPESKPTSVQATGSNGAAIPLTVSWPSAQGVQAMAVSRDGTRLAALIDVGGSVDVMASGIVRSSSGKPESLTAPVDFGAVAPGSVSSLSWIDDLTVATISLNSKGASTISQQTIGGDVLSTVGPDQGASIGPGNGTPAYWILTSDQSLQWPRGTGWQERVDKVAFVGQQLGKPQ